MTKIYRYPVNRVLRNFGFVPAGLALISLVALLILLSNKNNDALIILGVLSIFIIPALISIIPIVSMCKAIVVIDSDGIRFMSPLNDLKIRWSDVREVSKVNILTARYYKGPPRDIRILFDGAKKLNILHFIVSCEKDERDENGIGEFESDLKRYVGDHFLQIAD